jgi:hypothetical protein
MDVPETHITVQKTAAKYVGEIKLPTLWAYWSTWWTVHRLVLIFGAMDSTGIPHLMRDLLMDCILVFSRNPDKGDL